MENCGLSPTWNELVSWRESPNNKAKGSNPAEVKALPNAFRAISVLATADMLDKEYLVLKGEVVVHHANDDGTVLIKVFVAMRENEPIYEELPARRLNKNRYELLSSPGLALNLARGDIIEIGNSMLPATVVERGGNFCVQIYADEIASEDFDELEKNVKEGLGGTIDGVYRGNLAITAPASAGLEEISRVFDAFTTRTGVQWYFANIYKNFEDITDETLLDWWH